MCAPKGEIKMTDKIMFSTTLKHWDLPASCTVKFTIKEDSWIMELKKIGSTCWLHIHIADPIMDEIAEKASQWRFRGIEYYEPHDSYSTVLSCYIGYLDLVKILEKLNNRENIFDFENGARFKGIN